MRKICSLRIQNDISLKKNFNDSSLMSSKTLKKIWDLWCICSIIGIWPRYIEPRLISSSRHALPIPNLPSGLEGLKIIQISDLHFGPQSSHYQLKKLLKKIAVEKPDLVLYTGDFLCEAILYEPTQLKNLLSSISAPLGCYAVLGNHDYNKPISVNSNGDYDTIQKKAYPLVKGLQRLYKPVKPTGKVTRQARSTTAHLDLKQLLKEANVVLLENETTLISVKDTFLNISGLGEHMAGQASLEKAMESYNLKYPGILMVHNPDAIPKLDASPASIILSGHTHGNQVNLPFFKRAFIASENGEYLRGAFNRNSMWIYVSRGIGASFPFRWCAVPEILILTLTGSQNVTNNS